MRLFLSVLTFAVLVAFTTPASAGLVEDVATGLNSVVTSVADPVMGLVDGDQVFDLGPLNIVTDRVTGAVTGTFTGVERAVRGALDIPCALIPCGPFSLESRFTVVPGSR